MEQLDVSELKLLDQLNLLYQLDPSSQLDPQSFQLIDFNLNEPNFKNKTITNKDDSMRIINKGYFDVTVNNQGYTNLTVNGEACVRLTVSNQGYVNLFVSERAFVKLVVDDLGIVNTYVSGKAIVDITAKNQSCVDVSVDDPAHVCLCMEDYGRITGVRDDPLIHPGLPRAGGSYVKLRRDVQHVIPGFVPKTVQNMWSDRTSLIEEVLDLHTLVERYRREIGGNVSYDDLFEVFEEIRRLLHYPFIV